MAQVVEAASESLPAFFGQVSNVEPSETGETIQISLGQEDSHKERETDLMVAGSSGAIAFTHGRTFLLSIWKPRSRLVRTSCTHRLPLACLTVKCPLKLTVISCRFNAHTGVLDGRLNPGRTLGQPRKVFFGLYRVDTCLLHTVGLA